MYSLATVADTGEPMGVPYVCSLEAHIQSCNGGFRAHLQDVSQWYGTILECPAPPVADHIYSILHMSVGRQRWRQNWP